MSAPVKTLSAGTSTRTSLLIFFSLMAGLVLATIVLQLASVDAVVSSQEVLFSLPTIGLLTVAGGFCVWLGPRAGLPDLWDPSGSPRKWLLFPAVVGLGLGAVALGLNGLFGTARIIAEAGHVPTINVPFPESLLFYTAGAIVVETAYRLILITVPLWLIGTVILHGRGRTTVFWTVALLTSVVEAVGQMSLVAGHTGVMLALGVGMYGINVLEARLFWRYGFLAPLVFRAAFYLVWHGIASAIGV